MSAERLFAQAVLHICKHKDVDINNAVLEFARMNGRRLKIWLYQLLVIVQKVDI